MEGYRHFLKIMNELQEELSDDNKVNEQEIEFFQNWLKKYYKKNCSEYIEFINTFNGLDFNGTIIYSLNGNCSYNIFKLNETWWNEDEKLREYIFFANDPVSLYGLNIKNEKYYVLSGVKHDLLEEYKTFYDLLIRVLEERWLIPKNMKNQKKI